MARNSGVIYTDRQPFVAKYFFKQVVSSTAATFQGKIASNLLTNWSTQSLCFGVPFFLHYHSAFRHR